MSFDLGIGARDPDYWIFPPSKPRFLLDFFTEFTKLLDLCKSALEYNNNDFKLVNVNNNLEKFIDSIIPGLDNLKKTYSDDKKIVAKITSVILTFIDYKEFLKKEIEKRRNVKNTQRRSGGITIVNHSNSGNNYNTQQNSNNVFVNFQKNNNRFPKKMSY